MTAYDIIDAKKRGGALSEEQIRFFVRGIADGSVSDAQIAAFCMAVLLRGMTDGECFVLTDAMTRSGEVAFHDPRARSRAVRPRRAVRKVFGQGTGSYGRHIG